MNTTFQLGFRAASACWLRIWNRRRELSGPALASLGRCAALLLALLGTGLAGIARGQVVTEFPIPTTNSIPIGIAAGPDGNLWFTESSGNKIARITTAGVITEFAIPTTNGGPGMITADPDGSIWFTENLGNQIGRITTAGVITEFPVPTPNSGPFGIAVGPDANLWFTEQNVDKIGRITTAGVITEFPIPTAGAFPHVITAGPDGNLWFTETFAAETGRITTDGEISEFPTSGGSGIAAGPDGNLWIAEGGKIGRLTVAGVLTEFSLVGSTNGANQISAGPDGNLWFTDAGASLIGRITTAGVIDEFATPSEGTPIGIGAGPDGDLWFTEYYGNKIGRITTGTTIAQPMAVDARAVTGGSSNANGVLEPGETVQVTPSWRNTLADSEAFTGTASSLTGPDGPTYAINDGAADYGSISANATADCNGATGDCYLMTISGIRPTDHWDATFTENLSTNSIAKTWTLHVGASFPDVPPSHQFYAFVENLFHNGVTSGCGVGTYCPDGAATRAQMAVFLLRGKLGATHAPPAATGTVFNDVPLGAFAGAFIEELARFQITGGCGGGNYCPESLVTRAQMAVFLLKSEHGSTYTPPACTGVFGDVACPSPFADWIEQLAAEGITGGCGGGDYCPGSSVTRGQMAVFLVKTFGLELYGPVAPSIAPSNPYTVHVAHFPGNNYHFIFLPSTIHIHVGDTITWLLGGAHSTIGPDWDSGPGLGSFAHTFTQPGTFDYHCGVNHPGHPHDPGVVIVDP